MARNRDNAPWLTQPSDSSCSLSGHIEVARRWLLWGAFLALLAGCTNEVKVRSENVLKLQIGMTRDHVMSIMGEPERREIHGNVEFLIYQTDIGEQGGWNFTPIGLVDGRVTGWGRVYYEAAMGSRVGPDGTLPKKR